MIVLVLTSAQLRRLVDGGVRDAMRTHPEYFTERGRVAALDGVSKRVQGTLKSFAAQAAEGRDPCRNAGREESTLYLGS